MGACASVHKYSPGSVINPVTLGSKLEIPASPANGNPPIVLSFHAGGEMKLCIDDSKPSLNSDSEDDFFSVNGDFTPSRTNSPVHQSFSPATPIVPIPEPASGSVSGESQKKTLTDLFKERLEEDRDSLSDPKLVIAGRTVNRESIPENGKKIGSVHGWIPRLVPCSSFTETRRRKTSNGIGKVDICYL